MSQYDSADAPLFSTLAYSNNAASYAETAIATAFDDPTIAKMNTLLATQDDSGGDDAVFQTLNRFTTGAPIGGEGQTVDVNLMGRRFAAKAAVQGTLPDKVYEVSYIPSEHVELEGYQGDGIVRLVRMRLSNDEELPEVPLADDIFSDFYFCGRVLTFQKSGVVTTQIMTASLTFTVTQEETLQALTMV